MAEWIVASTEMEMPDDVFSLGSAAGESVMSPTTALPEVNSVWRMRGTNVDVSVVAVEKRGRGYRVLAVDTNGDVTTGRYHRLNDFYNVFFHLYTTVAEVP